MRSSSALEAEYRRRVERELEEMHRSLVHWISAEWRDHPGRLAMDEAPVTGLRRAMEQLARRWTSRFDDFSVRLAEYFARRAEYRVRRDLEAMLRDAGFGVKFRMTVSMRDAFSAVLEENVTLIRGLARDHLEGVASSVMRSVQTGRDLKQLTDDLEEGHGIVRRRAARIALDQNNKATAVMTRVRQEEAGITRAIWMHSHGGRTPRKEHLAFDGKEYDVARGAFLEGKWTWPGVEINCRCFSRPIIPGL